MERRKAAKSPGRKVRTERNDFWSGMKIFATADKISNFIVEVGIELKKSAWPTRSELLESTVVVIMSVVIVAIFVGLSDLFLMRILKLII